MVRSYPVQALCVVAVTACTPGSSSSELAIERIEPSEATNVADVPVEIDGSGFAFALATNLDNGSSTISQMTASVGSVVLADATRVDNGRITGTVPAGLPVGTYDVTVDIGDRMAVLTAGYTVIDPPAPFMPLHVDPTDGAPGTGDLTLSGNVTIDTEQMMITGALLPANDPFDTRPQLGTGGELAVLHVGALLVAPGANIRVIGSRPFVIVAGGDVTIQGIVDGSGHGTQPGPGGASSGMGGGAGGGGMHGDNASDGGGGGGGYGTVGGRGGNVAASPPTCGALTMGGGGGPAYGDEPISVLVGGSAGAPSSGTSCPQDRGGAGGGAIQISSKTSIQIGASGSINVGGGGGSAGTNCGAQSGDVNGATGGGSGGSLVLQAPMIANLGILAANGGGGGGATYTNGAAGTPGEDGHASAAPAQGGTGPSATGGSGGALGGGATAGGNTACGFNGAGGGGAVGRIAVSSTYTGNGTVSPAPDTTLPM